MEQTLIREIAQRARESAGILAGVASRQKDEALMALAEALMEHRAFLMEENAKDLERARNAGLSAAMIDRLTLKETTIAAMAQGVREVAALPDPVGRVTAMWRRPNGLLVGRMRIPLGVIGIIYESRPNVTVDAAALCLKSGNAVILRGGSEAIASNLALGELIGSVLKRAHLPAAAVQVVPVTDRGAVQA
ncbi:MAG: aldehyde dehydrogenase family protein, partial [Syntrophales bacterium]|nr:aldehyde dehydrogenase family protein [Syntrophales bacterium]